MRHLWIVGDKISRVGSYEVCSNVTSNAWLGRKDVWFLSFQYAIFFCDMVRAVISKRMDKRSHALPRGKLTFWSIFICLYICCLPSAHSFRSHSGQLTPIIYLIYLFIHLFIFIHLFLYFLSSAVRRPFPHFTDTQISEEIIRKK